MSCATLAGTRIQTMADIEETALSGTVWMTGIPHSGDAGLERLFGLRLEELPVVFRYAMQMGEMVESIA